MKIVFLLTTTPLSGIISTNYVKFNINQKKLLTAAENDELHLHLKLSHS